MENERQLIENYLKGDEKSLEILVKKYLKPIYNFAYKYAGNSQEAEDIAQETFVKAWKNLKKFDEKRSFGNWIFFIAKNTALDFLKKKKTMQFSDLQKDENSFAEKFVDSSPPPDEVLEKKSAMRKLTKALNKLLPKYRQVLLLRHNDDLTFREISRRLNEPLNTVKSRHRRALISLKKILGKL
jgi:RNA polymerase sigma-70 factor (ECF subfamily)